MCRYRRALYFSSWSLSVSTALFPAPITILNGLLAPGRVASRQSQMARTVQKQSFPSVSAIRCVKRREGARVFVENYKIVEPEGNFSYEAKSARTFLSFLWTPAARKSNARKQNYFRRHIEKSKTLVRESWSRSFPPVS